MSILRSALVALATSALTTLTGAAPAPALDLTYFKGSITDVGVQRGPGQVGGVEFRVEGEFTYLGAMDLSKATLTLDRLFDESAAGGGQELMKTIDDASFLPFFGMVRSRSSKTDEGKWESGRFRPQMRMQIENNDGEWEFKFKLDRGLMRERPSLCVFDPVTRKEYTSITFGFTLDDGTNVLPIETTRVWECVKEGRYHMRSR
jgi:hypothetical protein